MEDFLKWNDSWLTGIEALDAQHAEVAACINTIAKNCFRKQEQAASADEAESENMAVWLYDITRHHFQYEEQLMHDAGYPGYAAHVREHSLLLAELKLMIRTSFSADGGRMDCETLTALKTWFIAHIAQSDKLFAQFMSRQCEAGSVAVESQ